jgi:hypothetical protein
MKALLCLPLLLCPFLLSAGEDYKTERAVDKVLLRNWNIAKTNNPAVVGFQKQLDIKQAQLNAKDKAYEQRRELLEAQQKAAGKQGYSHKELEPLKEEIHALSREVEALKGKIDVQRLNYNKANRKAVEEYVANHPELLQNSPTPKKRN